MKKSLAAIHFLGGCLFLGLYSTALLAASDGTLGTTSTGLANASMTIEPKVRISDVDPVIFGSLPTTPTSVSREEFVCVYSNMPGHNYKITASMADGFSLKNLSGQSIPFELFWSGSTSTSNMVQLSNQVPQNRGGGGSALSGSSTADCQGSTNAALRVTIPGESYSGKTAGNYSGTLQLTVEPD